MSEAPSKTFTGEKLDLQHRICADRRVTDGQFRMFARVLRAMNAKTSVAVIGDETIMAEVPSCSSPSTCKANRRRLQELGYWTVKPGSGSATTEYTIDLKAGMGLVEGLKELRSARIQRRRRTTMAWRARKAAVRHADDGLPNDAVRHGDDGVVRHAHVGQSVMQDPPYTFITPSTGTPSYRATEESRYLQGHDDALDPVVDDARLHRDVHLALGRGDIDLGRMLADAIGRQQVDRLKDRVRVDGVIGAADELNAAAARARRLLQSKADGASHVVA